MSVIIEQIGAIPPPSGVVKTNIIAQAGGQGAATLLTARKNIIKVCPVGGGVLLQILPDNTMKVFNRCGTGQVLTVYPPFGTSFEENGTNVPVTIGDGNQAEFTFDNILTWAIS
jgi:hypothetical protein